MTECVLPLIKFPDGRWADAALVGHIWVHKHLLNQEEWNVQVRFRDGEKWTSDWMNDEDQAVRMADAIAQSVNDARALCAES